MASPKKTAAKINKALSKSAAGFKLVRERLAKRAAAKAKKKTN